MHLELAEGAPGNFRYRRTIPAYHRRANDVPAHYRYLQDSSLFSFRLNDCDCNNLSTKVIQNKTGYLFVLVPDPAGKQAPRAVREDMFDALPADEFAKIIAYIEPVNSPEVLNEVIARRCQAGLGDGEIPSSSIHPRSTVPAERAINTVHSVFQASLNRESFWDKKIFGIKTKYVGGAAALYLLLKH